MDAPHFQEIIAAVTGEEGRQAFEAYQETGDESHIRSLFDRLLGDALAAERSRDDEGNAREIAPDRRTTEEDRERSSD
jgi:hypothetical protein